MLLDSLTDELTASVFEWRGWVCADLCGVSCGYVCDCHGCPNAVSHDNVDTLVEGMLRVVAERMLHLFGIDQPATEAVS